jgi:hypothetical protein
MSVDWEYLFTGKPSTRPNRPPPLGMPSPPWSMRTAWKLSAGLIAITFRILGAVVRSIARGNQRHRNNW